ncbi:CHAT domain-containing protein [Streptomyces sp. NEAU-YJ-81]|uniref:CHAT domain-containing protein n=1 Tax=Streptomyces sp. NEAU-YJ-81 TaxID=2820288 RepID=UPI001ABC2569|nr:CHAT domain-containing protein [Streptomyces sp. NEAU-YJ-81]MBO3676902.1 CHAT domain-containing protein [Streptomyces sp. NEAU-YJ-81]
MPMYAVVFEEGEDLDAKTYSPFLYRQLGEGAKVTIPHGLSRAASAALPGLWYCLHLPNTVFQLADISITALKMSQELNLGHQILLVPIEIFDQEHCAGFMSGLDPVLTVCPDHLAEECDRRAEALGFSFPSITYSEMSNESIRSHWKQIRERYRPDVEYLGREPEMTRRLDTAPMDLPRRWLARQMNWDSTETQINSLDELDSLTARTFHEQAVLSAFAHLEREGADDEQAEQDFPRAYAEARVRIPVTLALPGVAPAYARIAYDTELRSRARPLSPLHAEDTWSPDMHLRSDELTERAAIEFVTTHHALAQGGVGLLLPSVPPEAFVVLAELERHFSGTESGASVRRLLERLNEAAKPLWSQTVVEIIRRARALTVFTNFPIGLLRMPGDTAPLSARIPIAYRPMMPLLRTVQDELGPSIPIELNRKIRVLVAECIPAHDPVGQISRIGWRTARENVEVEASGTTMKIVETLSLDQLRRAVADEAPHFLVISAHGTLGKNSAGLVIGEEICIELGLERPPPVVILSACHVAPRGRGAVSITDLLLREGVRAVLGTQVPVDVRRNAILMARFFVNITAAFQQGAEHATLLEVWHWVQASNAVNDILGPGNQSLNAWSRSITSSGNTVLTEFMSNRSARRLRLHHIYEDTETILGEIADDQGQGARVRNWFRKPGYVPESLFYLFAGKPDRIFISNLLDRTEKESGLP